MAVAMVAGSAAVYAQGGVNYDKNNNAITTTVPFLLISPDARGAALGDAGVASDPDANSGHWNAAKFAFIEKNGGMAISFTPWLRQLVNDINLGYVSIYGRVSKRSVVSGALRYFSLGTINFTDNQGNSLGTFNPNEFQIGGTYSSQLSNHLALGIGLNFIYSNLTGGQLVQGAETRPGIAGAGDIGLYWKNNKKTKDNRRIDYAFGLSMNNIGNKITYTTSANADFIPINLRFGGFTKIEIDEYNDVSFLLDFNKLMVPTPPIYALDSNGMPIFNPDGSQKIAKGMDPNVPVLQGMVQSFYDAPGGFTEELQEFIISPAVEYWYQKQFAVRAGYHHEHLNKGNRKYLTFGLGFRYQVFGLDVAYLVPLTQRNPLQNTLRFTLHFDFQAFSDQKK